LGGRVSARLRFAAEWLGVIIIALALFLLLD